MLSITIGSTQIPVDPGISLQTVLKSPLFATSDSRIPGSYIFNTSFPATTELRKEFGNAHRLGKNARASAELPYVIQLGILKYVGTCVVKYASPETYDIAFKINGGDFAGIISNKTLKDLDLGGDIAISDTGSAAYSEGFTRNVPNQVVPSDDTFYLSFSLIVCDLGSNFSPIASEFTCTKNGEIKVQVGFVFSESLAMTPRLRLYRNNSVYDTATIVDGCNIFNFTVTCYVGTVIKVAIYAAYASNDEEVIRYTVSNLMIYYYDTNIFDSVVQLNQYSCDYTIFPIHNEKLLDNFPDDSFILDNLSLKTLYSTYFKVFNYFLGDTFPLFIMGIVEEEVLLCANIFTPFIYCSKLLNEIGILTGYTIVNSPFDVDIEFEGAVLFNAFAENTYTSSNTRLIPVKSTFNLLNHVPEMKLADFIAWISTATGYMPIINNSELSITFVKIKTLNVAGPLNPTIAFPGILLENPKVTIEPEYKGIKLELKIASTDAFLSDRIKDIESKMVYKGSVAALGNLPTTGNLVNDYYLVTDANAFYVWQYNETTYTITWCFYSRDWPLIYTEGEEPYLEISTQFSPILTTEMLDETPGAPADRLWIIPQTEQPGILEGFPDSLGAEYGIQMLFYKGMSLDSNNETYPLGTTRLEDYSGNAYFTNFNARSVFNLQYKEFLQWLAYDAKPVTVRAIMDSKALAALRFEKIYRYKGISFLIKEIRVNLLHDSLSVAELDIYTC